VPLVLTLPPVVQNLYVLQRSWEGGGRLFDAFFIQVLWCLFLMVLFVGARKSNSLTLLFVGARKSNALTVRHERCFGAIPCKVLLVS